MIRILVASLVLVTACQAEPLIGKTAKVERDELVVQVDVEGTLQAVDSVDLGTPGVPDLWNYKIAMMAEEGVVVETGQPVLMFDASDLHRRLDEKTAERDSAATQLEVLRSTAKVARQDERLAIAEAEAALRKARLKADVPERLVSSIEIGKAKLEVDLAVEKLEFLRSKAEAATARDRAEMSRWQSKQQRADARVREITASIGQMTVVAPRSGTVIYLSSWEGEKKKVGDGAWRGERILQVVSLDVMKGDGQVDEVHLGDLALDQPVSLRLEAQADVLLRGKVQKIARSVRRASPENPLKIVRVDVELDDDGSSKLRPGMRFRGSIETDRIADALILPLSAISITPQGPVARRRVPGGVELVPLTLGARNESHAVLLDGLSEGDEVLYPEEAAP